MDLGIFVLDKQLLDSEDRRCGKVDDLMLETDGNGCLVVKGILTEPGALAHDIGARTYRLLSVVYRALGVTRPEEVCVDWNLVSKIDVVIHLSKTRDELLLNGLQNAISRRFIRRIPGA